VKCEYCGFINTGDVTNCKNCGEDLFKQQGITPEQSSPEEKIGSQNDERDQLSLITPDISHTIETIKKSLAELNASGSSEASDSSTKDVSTIITGIQLVPKGGFWIRFLAYAIDQIIIYLISFLLLLIAALAVGMHYSPAEVRGYLEQLGNFVTFPYFFTLICLNMIYNTYFIGASGQTIGKLVCGLKVVQTSGEPVSYGQAFLRWVGYLVSSIFFYLGYIWIAIDANRQGWHDKIADTCVIRV